MKKTHLNLVLILFVASLTACSGGSTQFVDYAPVDNTPKLNMKESIYKVLLPSGNTLTITTDQSGTTVNGAYTIRNGAAIISSGTVSNIVSQITLKGYPGSPCPDEAITIVPTNINATNSEADITLSGQKSCSESLTTTRSRLSKFVPLATARMFSKVIINTNQEVSISVASGDNVNFVGSVTLEDISLPASATGTIVGTVTNSSTIPSVSNAVVEINNPAAFGFVFTRTTNFSGHFLALNDSISAVNGHVRTSISPLANQYFISEIGASVTNINGTATVLGPVTVPFSSAVQTYTPL